MATLGQMTFLSRGPLFDPQVLRQYVADHAGAPPPDESARIAVVRDWLSSLVGAATKETALEQSFNAQILGSVLGYKLYPSAAASAYPKAPTSLTGIGQEPDVLLGRFVAGEEAEPVAVLELKSPGTDFDVPQSRTPRLTPVEQAFEYGEQILGIRWVLVSDMRRIRLYSVDSRAEFELFDLAACLDNDAGVSYFRRLFYLLHHDFLVGTQKGADGAAASLLAKSQARQREIKGSFYQAYYEIRMDLLAAVETATEQFQPTPSRMEILEATQRLLDRMLFLYYCEDTPDQLIPRETVRSVTEAARRLPGSSENKVYEALKALFREVDAGSPPANLVRLNGYNGELFKEHPIIERINLPDSLHDKTYVVDDPDGTRRFIRGAWGLHEFDFWRELNEHLLGHIFEESLSDLVEIAAAGEPVSLADKLAERKRHGIYYTTEILSDYLSASALRSLLAERREVPEEATESEELAAYEEHVRQLGELKIVDFACGSGAFLVSAYQELLRDFWTVQDAILHLRGSTPDLLTQSLALTQAKLLRDSLYGSDLLPQAVEITKLALWLRSARKDEKVADLGTNIVAVDSLDVAAVMRAMDAALGTFDLVLGNPPWGGDVDATTKAEACELLGLDSSEDWDSFELFVALAISALRDGGRLALVLPDTLFRREKAKTRRLVLDGTTIEKLHNLGPGWFPNVKMGTVLLQARRGSKPLTSSFSSFILGGRFRERAIQGMLPLTQVEAQFAKRIPQERSDGSPDAEMQIFRSVTDDDVMRRIENASVLLGDACERSRGVEMSKSGLVWRCPNCMALTVPGTKEKGGGYKSKKCPVCGLSLSQNDVEVEHLVRKATLLEEGEVWFVDGDDIKRRYLPAESSKALRLGVESIKYKSGETYRSPKIMLRKTGIGLVAALDEEDLWCPQTIFIYRVRSEWRSRGYDERFVLAALLSRTLAYYIFKRFSEVDPDRSHAHVTYDRLDQLPVPALDLASSLHRTQIARITEHVDDLLAGRAEIGGPEDWAIELALRELWGLDPAEGAYINGEFSQLPDSQPLRDLFPSGPPRPLRAVA